MDQIRAIIPRLLDGRRNARLPGAATPRRQGKRQASQRQSFEGRPLTKSIATYFKDNRLSFKAVPEFGRLSRPWSPKGELVGRHEFSVIRRLQRLSFSPIPKGVSCQAPSELWSPSASY